ncbi:MAG TPA: folylpolyglutamate synthase/dihydrofolate synthase family protein [Opitutales bacterium]|nr:folylpolyglutamate synthase/dihydrofolate synthase family protein [Opitutales bacterium]
MDYSSATDYLFNLKGKGGKYGIDRMRLFVEALGNPQKELRVIHVAGTNGKGSVSAMCESICRAAGLRTGLYSSPHLVRLGERVQVNREILTEAQIVAYTLELKEVAEKITAESPDDHPTFFEFMTAMAILHFVREKVDIAIFEVGLGGRLDATNVVDSEVSVITSIGLDHCEQLGTTLEAVAREKAGILKPEVPVVIGLMETEARQAIEAVAHERNCPVFAVADLFGNDRSRFPTTALPGEHQRINAAIASAVFQVIRNKLPVSPEVVRQGLEQVKWPGRWDVREIAGKKLIFEAAHNPQGAEVLGRELEKLVAAEGRPIVAVGALGDDRARALLETVARFAREIYLFAPDQPRATPVERLRSFIPSDFEGKVEVRQVADVFSVEAGCSLGEPGDTIVVTGSIYLIGEILASLESDRVKEARLQD